MNKLDQSVSSIEDDRTLTAPLVSVIIPAYNAEKYVIEAIRSVLDQDYQPIEVLLIDDGSEDSTVNLVKDNTPQVKIIQQANTGVAAARNTGLRYASGEFISFLDADDGWFSGKLTAQVNYLQQHPEVGLVFHKWFVWKPDGTGLYVKPQGLPVPVLGEINSLLSGWIYPQLLLDCVIHTSTVMMRREVAKVTGFFETTLINGEDYNYWIRVSRNYEIHQLTGIYSFYRMVAGSLTNDTPKSDNYGYRVIKGAIDQWGLSSPDGVSLSKSLADKRLAQLAFSHGYGHYYYGSAEWACRAFFDTLRHDPLMWRALVYLLLSKFRRIFGR